MLEKVVHPWPIRIANQADRWLRATGIELPRFEPEHFKKAVRRKTGLGDFGDDGFEAGLAALCRSAQVDGPFNAIGKFMLVQAISTALTQRLRRIEFRWCHPDLFEKDIRAPLIVTGLPRSGTTFSIACYRPHPMPAVCELGRSGIRCPVQESTDVATRLKGHLLA